MSLIKPKTKQAKTAVRVKIDASIMHEINKYISWAGFDKKDDFFEQAASFIITKDKEYLKLKKNA